MANNEVGQCIGYLHCRFSFLENTYFTTIFEFPSSKKTTFEKKNICDAIFLTYKLNFKVQNTTLMLFIERVYRTYGGLFYRYLCNNKNKRKRYSKSFVQDIKLLESNFHKEISVIFENPLGYKKLLKKKTANQDGILDSIYSYSCLNSYKSNTVTPRPVSHGRLLVYQWYGPHTGPLVYC